VRISKWFKVDKKKFRDFPYLSEPVNEDIVFRANENRNRKLLEGEKIKVLICNRFEERKGYHSLYQALKLIDRKILKDFEFLIIGSGKQHDKYKQLLSTLNIDLEIKSWVEYERYIEHVRCTDILIHASLHEPFGIPPIDAMAHGKLVVTSDAVMSTFDRVIHGDNGFIFNAGDSEGLAQILKTIVQNRKIVYELGSKAFITSRSYTSANNIEVIGGLF